VDAAASRSERSVFSTRAMPARMLLTRRSATSGPRRRRFLSQLGDVSTRVGDQDEQSPTQVFTSKGPPMTETDAQPPAPDPALRRLEPLVGDWSMTGNLVGSSEENIVGRASFRWLEGGFFLQQVIEIDFAGQFQVKCHELIGYDPETGAFASHVYSNLSPTPLPYGWELRDNKLRISVSHGPLDATFEGTISDDGSTFSGGWRPNPGADETINVAYDVRGTRLS
jgi:hypothetical protein